MPALLTGWQRIRCIFLPAIMHFSFFRVVLSAMFRFLVVFCILGIQSLQAQQDRFQKPVFDSVLVETINYSSVFQDAAHKADVYQPHGDTSTRRPLLLYVHGGSFISGDKASDDCRDFCQHFARLGYTAVSVNYRLSTLLQFMQSKDNQMQTVMRAMADIKSAIRFFRADAAGSNTFSIDADKVFLGGYSAGAVAALHTAYIDSLNELTAAEQLLLKNAIGTLEGDAGNSGYASHVTALFSLAGALHKTAWVSPSEEPVWMAHSRDDATVSFNCAPGLGLPNVLELCGTGKLLPELRRQGILYDSMILEKEGHGWPSAANNNASFRKALDEIAKFFYPMVMPRSLGTNELLAELPQLQIYPNPISSGITKLQLQASEPLEFVRLVNPEGKIMMEHRLNGQEHSFEMEVAQMPTGLYWVQTAAGYAKVALER
jgi:acetyl esterase/lipase